MHLALMLEFIKIYDATNIGKETDRVKHGKQTAVVWY